MGNFILGMNNFKPEDQVLLDIGDTVIANGLKYKVTGKMENGIPIFTILGYRWDQ